MGYSISQSLISGQPPLLVFTLCLTAFGLTMVILAYVVGEQDVPNPDVQMDWNKFFKRVSFFKLCPVKNDTKLMNVGPLPRTSHKALYSSETMLNSSLHIVDESKSMSAMLSDVVPYASDKKFDSLDFVDISARVQFKLIGKMHPNSFFQVNGKVKGSLLSFTGKYDSLLFNISLSFIPPLNNSCFDGNCYSLWDVCLFISVPSDLISEAKNPERCDINIIPASDNLPAFFVDVKNAYKGDSSNACMELDYTPNSKLTEMLSLHDRSIVNLHLMHTSYFMFVMVMTLVCYSLIRGRYRHPKNTHSLEKVPLDA